MTTAGIVLAPLTNADAETLFGWINDRDLVLKNAAYRPVHEPQHLAWLQDITRRDDVAIFAIRAAGTGALIGVCQLRAIDRVHSTADLQIRIGDVSARGRGHGTEAVMRLLDFAFRDLNLHRVSLQVFADNAAAIRAYEKAGFTREGVLRAAAHVDGRYVDIVCMSVLRHEHER
jgi:RimJ/RimL family protein N-acetyltransferase